MIDVQGSSIAGSHLCSNGEVACSAEAPFLSIAGMGHAGEKKPGQKDGSHFHYLPREWYSVALVACRYPVESRYGQRRQEGSSRSRMA